MLLESILRSNEAFLRGERKADRLQRPVAILTCVDARLNDFLGPALGIAREDIVLVRNAGNVVLESGGDPLRSLAMGIYLKAANEIAVLGHTDCRMSQFKANEFLEALSAWGVSRQQLGPVDLRRWSGAFHDPRQNVRRSVELIGQCGYIPRKIPIHGLLIDIASGRIETVLDGYRQLERRSSGPSDAVCEPQGEAAPEPAGPTASRWKDDSTRQAAATGAPPKVPPVPPPPPVMIKPGALEAAVPEPPSRPLPKDLLGAVRVLRQAYAEAKRNPALQADLELIRSRVSRGENLIECIDLVERHLRQTSSERPDVVAALRIVREHAERSPLAGYVQSLLQQIL